MSDIIDLFSRKKTTVLDQQETDEEIIEFSPEEVKAFFGVINKLRKMTVLEQGKIKFNNNEVCLELAHFADGYEDSEEETRVGWCEYLQKNSYMTFPANDDCLKDPSLFQYVYNDFLEVIGYIGVEPQEEGSGEETDDEG